MLKFVVPWLVLALSGCIVVTERDAYARGDDWQDRQEYNREYIAGLQPGASMDAVRDALGSPDFSESENGVVVLYYRTHRVNSDGQTGIEETTGLHFVNGVLQSWARGQFRP